MERIYACIDLKSFYASIECVLRGLNPLTTNLVVADEERTEKTICLAISPSLKSYGLKGRARLFEVNEVVKKINMERKKCLGRKEFTGKSFNNEVIRMNPNIMLDFVIAKPQMSLYIKYSTMIYNIYLKHVSKDDIYVYSIDEVFMDITDYLKYPKCSPEEFITRIILDIEKETGITATGGIGTNLYLAKVAMDIVSKHIKPNKNNVRIAFLDEMTYRKTLWNHKPITDFWRVGTGYAKSLLNNNIYTMGDICRTSLDNEELLYDLFGINAELLIDHAWGYEPCTIKDIKKFKPRTNSLSRGQVLHEPYDYAQTKIIVTEMADLLSLDLVSQKYLTDEIVLYIGYDITNINETYHGEIKSDHYGRKIPREARGNIHMKHKTSSSKLIMKASVELFEKIINPRLLVRRISIAAVNLISEDSKNSLIEQMDLFSNNIIQDDEDEKKEKDVQKAILNIKKKYGKNAILRGMNLQKGATTIERNNEIGGHRA